MSEKVSVSAFCRSCKGTGLYVGMAERNGIAVVCTSCDGTGKITVSYEPFTERHKPRADIHSVHVARGYGLSYGHPSCDGGMPISEWEPGKAVPADEQLYCPYLYTGQDWCAHPRDPSNNHNNAPILGGLISNCPYWAEKTECWQRYHESETAPRMTR